MSSHDPRSSGCTPFEEELINAMNDFAHSTDSPAFDTTGMVHRTAAGAPPSSPVSPRP